MTSLLMHLANILKLHLSSTNCFIGHMDDLVIDDKAPYSATFQVPAAEVPVTMSDSDVALIKFDRLHDKRASYTMTGNTKYTTVAFTDITLQHSMDIT